MDDRPELEHIRLTVNGTHYERDVEPRRHLGDFLRLDLKLTGTHIGCEHGVCGACTVIVDNVPVRACLMFAGQASGAVVTTIEGLAQTDGALHPEPGLSATAYYEARNTTFANGTHLAEVEVDIDTGRVTIARYIVGHDCGLLINPVLVDGQVRGGVVHGIGNALFKRMIYDDAGQPLTTSYADYLLPTATEVPRIEIVHVESTSPLNPIGVKGAGEGGTIPAAACIIAAIEDALTPFGARIAEHPVSPARTRQLIRNNQA